MRGWQKVGLALLIYFAAIVLTFGYENARFTQSNHLVPSADALGAGIFWPIYWPFRLSMDLFPVGDKP